MEEWTTAEAALFEEAMEKHGKTFNDIWTDYLPWKTVKVAISIRLGWYFLAIVFIFNQWSLSLMFKSIDFELCVFKFFLSLMSIVYELLNQFIL